MGVAVRETKSETMMATLRETANSRSKRPMMVGKNKMGINTAMSEVLMERTVKSISFAPSIVAANGVVDDKAGGDGNRHDRTIVQTIAEQVHHSESAYQRERHGNAGNDGGPNV